MSGKMRVWIKGTVAEAEAAAKAHGIVLHDAREVGENFGPLTLAIVSADYRVEIVEWFAEVPSYRGPFKAGDLMLHT